MLSKAVTFLRAAYIFSRAAVTFSLRFIVLNHTSYLLTSYFLPLQSLTLSVILSLSCFSIYSCYNGKRPHTRHTSHTQCGCDECGMFSAFVIRYTHPVLCKSTSILLK